MKALKVFLLGLLYGWFLKFAIDTIYPGNELQQLRSENASLKQQIETLAARPQSLPPRSKSAPKAPDKTQTGKDDLKVIKGIGPAIERKLNEAGIDTYDALARLSVAELENILGSTKRLVKDEGNLIVQAQELARQKDQ